MTGDMKKTKEIKHSREDDINGRGKNENEQNEV